MLSFPKLLQLVLEKLEFLIFAQFSSKLFFLSNLNLKQINSKKAFCYAFQSLYFCFFDKACLLRVGMLCLGRFRTQLGVDRAGFEPATSRVQVGRSYQLNYRPTNLFLLEAREYAPSSS